MNASEQVIEEAGGRLAEQEAAGDFDALITELGERVRAQRRVLADARVQRWCARRWRDLFLREACEDADALAAARPRLRLPGGEERPPREAIARRFLRGGEQRWDDELPEPQWSGKATILFCPGLVNGLLPVRAFESAFPVLERERGWRVLRADAHPARSCSANMADLRAALDEGRGLAADGGEIDHDSAEPPGDVIAVGYSKGAADLLTLLAHEPHYARRVRAVVPWAGAVGGSYLADDMHATLRDVELPTGGPIGERIAAVLRLLAPMLDLDAITRRLDEYDVKGAVFDLTTPVRREFTERHGAALDSLDVPFLTLTAATRPTEVPYFQVQGALKLSGSDPDNDMQLTQAQAKVPLPLGVHLGVARAHHWDLSYPPFPLRSRMGSPNLDHRFPRAAALAAVVVLAGELGLVDRPG